MRDPRPRARGEEPSLTRGWRRWTLRALRPMRREAGKRRKEPSPERWRLATLVRTGLLGIVFVTLVAAGALALLTTYLHSLSDELERSVESVRAAEELQVGLLNYDRVVSWMTLLQPEGYLPSPPVLESNLRRRLQEARRHVQSEEEASSLVRVESAVEAYLRAVRDARYDALAHEALASAVGPHLDSAFTALDALVETNLAQARMAAREAVRIDRMANMISVGVIALVLLVVGAQAAAFRRGVVLPLSRFHAQVARFARGDRAARAPGEGPVEIRDLAREFNVLADASERRDRDQLAFLGGVAHDLRNPVASIGYSVSKLLRLGTAPDTDDALLEIERIERQARRLSRMISDFLDATLIEAGQLELRTGPHDVRVVLTEAVDAFRQATPDHLFDLQMPESPQEVDCDAVRVGQVVHNLLSNAVKYSPAGTRIQVALAPTDGEVEVTVVDEGCGIDSADQERIFEPFRRTGASRETVPGVGLGLFVSRRIAEAHGGRLTVESALGKGSTFRLRLPRELGRPLRGGPPVRGPHDPAPDTRHRA